MPKNPTLEGPRTPTPAKVYDVRIWKARIWKTGAGSAGAGVMFKAPYGVAINAAQVLARATARGQITRYQLGRVPTSQLRGLGREGRDALQRYEEAFAELGERHQIDWDA